MQNIPLSDWLLQAYAEYARSGSDLNRKNRWLYDAIRHALTTGPFQTGQKLPPSRELAKDMGVARITVMHAYKHLVTDGILLARVGAGTFISDARTSPQALPDSFAHPSDVGSAAINAAGFVPSLRAAKVLRQQGGMPTQQAGAFMPGIPDFQLFPQGLWLSVLNRTVRVSDNQWMDFATGAGSPALRRALAQHLGAERGLRCAPEQIVLTQSAQQAFDLCIKALSDPGDIAWIEDPCSSVVRNTLTINGVTTQALPLDAQGMAPPYGVSDGRRKRRSASPWLTRWPTLFVLTPANQYPSGVTMGLARQQTWVELARHTRAHVIEDDCEGDFGAPDALAHPLQSLDGQGRTVMIGTFAKTMYPGLSIGYVVAAPDLAPTLVRLNAELNSGGRQHVQNALAEFINQGHYRSHVQHMRRTYAERRLVLMRALAEILGETVVLPESSGGLHVTVRLQGISDHAVRDLALREQNIVACPLSACYASPSTAPQGLVLGFGSVPTDQIEAQVKRLAEAVFAAGSK